MTFYTDDPAAPLEVREIIEACEHRFTSNPYEADIVVSVNVHTATEAIKNNPYLRVYYIPSDREVVYGLDPRIRLVASWNALVHGVFWR